jgi:hypothetical protein
MMNASGDSGKPGLKNSCVPLALAVLILIGVGADAAQAIEQVVMPFGSTVRYALYPGVYATVPPEVISLGYDDSDWAIGAAPFGASGEGCPFQVQIVTGWPVGTTLVMRLWVDLPPGSSKLGVEHRRSASWQGWYNGENWGSFSGAACPYAQSLMHVGGPYYYPPLPERVLLVFVFQSFEHIDWTYADFQVTVNLPEVGANPVTWGGLKGIY